MSWARPFASPAVSLTSSRSPPASSAVSPSSARSMTPSTSIRPCSESSTGGVPSAWARSPGPGDHPHPLTRWTPAVLWTAARLEPDGARHRRGAGRHGAPPARVERRLAVYARGRGLRHAGDRSLWSRQLRAATRIGVLRQVGIVGLELDDQGRSGVANRKRLADWVMRRQQEAADSARGGRPIEREAEAPTSRWVWRRSRCG